MCWVWFIDILILRTFGLEVCNMLHFIPFQMFFHGQITWLRSFVFFYWATFLQSQLSSIKSPVCDSNEEKHINTILIHLYGFRDAFVLVDFKYVLFTCFQKISIGMYVQEHQVLSFKVQNHLYTCFLFIYDKYPLFYCNSLVPIYYWIIFSYQNVSFFHLMSLLALSVVIFF